MHIEKRKCESCGEEKMPCEFNKMGKSSHRLQYRCKECMKKARKKTEIEHLRKIFPSDIPWNP